MEKKTKAKTKKTPVERVMNVKLTDEWIAKLKEQAKANGRSAMRQAVHLIMKGLGA